MLQTRSGVCVFETVCDVCTCVCIRARVSDRAPGSEVLTSDTSDTQQLPAPSRTAVMFLSLYTLFCKYGQN